MWIEVERRSVAMGDDVDAPHHERWKLPDGATVGDVVTEVATRRYLAQIWGGKATWVVQIDGEPVAVIAQQWERPRVLGDPGRPFPGGLVYADYLTQRDPEAVWSRLLAGDVKGLRRVPNVVPWNTGS